VQRIPPHSTISFLRGSFRTGQILLTLASVAFGQRISTPNAGSQPSSYVSRIWRTQDGLPENKVRAIAQTPDGYLWIGTSGGLARFDGVRFVVYARFNTPAMTADDISALAVARDGSLWAATDGGGLLHYQDGRFRSFGPNQGLANEFVRAVHADRSGNVWAATNRGLFRSAGEKFERLDEELHLPNIAFFGLYEGSDGRVFAGGPAGLFGIENGKLRPYDAGNELEVYYIGAARDGSLWLSTTHGLRITGNDSQDSKRPYTKSMINAIMDDHAGAMWLGTEGDGLYLVQDGRKTPFRAPASLPNNNILAILEDREQNIWVGTADGLVRMSSPDVGLLTSRDGLSDDNVSTVYCDHHGSLWFTTVTGGAFRYANGRIEAVRFPPPANSLRIRGAYEDRTGAFWFGTNNQGVVRVANGKTSRFTMSQGLRNNGIQAFFEDRGGNLWIGTTSGLSRWDGSKFRNYYLEDGLSYGWVRAIVEDQQGDMLVGTERGLNRFHDGKFVPDPAFAELSRDRIWSILPDRQNRDTLWIATRGAGLVRVRNGKVSRITTQEGLLSNSIFQLIGDDAGRLWMSGPLGISSASFVDLNSAADGQLSSIAVFSYGTGDGLDSTQINGGVQPAGCIGPGGEVWFPSVKGAVHFKPSRYRSERHPPVRMESVLIDDRIVPASGEVVVAPRRRRVEIEFTSCSLRAPERVAFRYKLDGFDGQWIAATRRRAANYYNLPPGRYRFRVIAHNGSLDDSSSEAGVFLVVQPYFYQTGWFYALVLAAAGACVGGVLLLHERQARDRYNLRLAERARIAREMHDTVVQGCVGVSTLIEAAVGCASSDQAQMLECLDNARIHLRLTLDEARQALSDLRHDSFDNGLAGALSELTRAVSGEKGIPVTLEVAGSAAPLEDSVNRTLLLVTREAIRNAVVHGAPSAIGVCLSFEPSAVRLDIQDNGCGFEPAQAPLAASGHFGILGMRERMEQIWGSLEVASSPGYGTTITAHLPLGHSMAAS
jgi:ligand-binding sensor domain-containing protein/signal transduction histidine kinase